MPVKKVPVPLEQGVIKTLKPSPNDDNPTKDQIKYQDQRNGPAEELSGQIK